MMKSKLILLLILTYTAISRLFLLTTVPQMINSSPLTRMISASANLGSAFILFFIAKNYFKSTKIALISVWFFAGLPWVFTEGRIVSQPSTALFFILLMILFAQRVSSGFKYVFWLLTLPIVYFVYPQIWIFRILEFKFSLSSFITNLFILTSSDFLFFKNITFWWGGVREFGVMFLSMLPFFLVGIYELFIAKRVKLLILFGLITFIAVLSPFFPESREFYFATPLFSLAVALGIYKLMLHKYKAVKTFVICLFLMLIYEFSQFIHFYLVHYPQQILSNSSQIHEAF